MDMMNTEFLLIALIILAGSFIQGFSGFGFALVTMPLLSLLIPVKEAVPLVALCGLIINIWLVIELRQHLEFAEVKYLIAGSVLGIPAGAYFLSSAPSGALKILLGIIVLLFVIFTIFRFIKPTGVRKEYGIIYGIFSGLLGGAFNTNGPPVLIYFYLQGWDKTRQKSMITGFFIFTSSFIVLTHLIGGISAAKTFSNFLWLLPAVLAGIFLGSRLFTKVSTEFFNKFVLIGLTVIAVILIIS